MINFPKKIVVFWRKGHLSKGNTREVEALCHDKHRKTRCNFYGFSQEEKGGSTFALLGLKMIENLYYLTWHKWKIKLTSFSRRSLVWSWVTTDEMKRNKEMWLYDGDKSETWNDLICVAHYEALNNMSLNWPRRVITNMLELIQISRGKTKVINTNE